MVVVFLKTFVVVNQDTQVLIVPFHSIPVSSCGGSTNLTVGGLKMHYYSDTNFQNLFAETNTQPIGLFCLFAFVCIFFFFF